MRPVVPPRFVRALLGCVTLALFSCVSGDSTGTSVPIAIGLVPSFQVVPSDFDADPIDRIRMTARDAVSGEVLGSSVEDVDPVAAEWIVQVGVELGGESARDVVVEVELLSGDVVQWSGRAGPFTVTAGSTVGGDGIRSVLVYRGPLDNLEVLGVTIAGTPDELLVGSSATATASVELPSGSSANPEIFWVSLDPTIATVAFDGGTATVTGVAPGTVIIAAAAGPEFDEVTVEVLARVRSVDVAPVSATVSAIGVTVPFSASVIDGFGSPAPTEPLTWTSGDTGVATVDASGIATSVGLGTTTIQATAAGVSGSGTLTVLGPDLVPGAFSVTPDGGVTIVNFDATDIQVEVINQGQALALATTLGVRVLDAVTGLEAHPTLEFAVPPLNPGDTFPFRGTPVGQSQPVQLPALLRFEAVVDFLDEAVEEDEANNASTSADVAVLPAAPPGFDLQWVGTVDDVWETAGNWSTGQLPQPTDDVWIAATGVIPVLSTAVTVTDLSLQAGATLTMQNAPLTVLGNLDAGTTIEGTGTIQMTGPAATLQGTIEQTLIVSGVVDAVGPVTLSTSLVVDNGGRFRVGVQTVSVGVNFSTATGAVFEMTASGGEFSVAGNVNFNGGSLDGLLTSGVLRVGGNFFVGVSDPGAFVGSASHTTVLDGPQNRSISFSLPGATQQRFGSVIFASTGIITVTTDLATSGFFDINQGLVDASGRTIFLGGSLVDDLGGLLVGTVDFTGSPAAVPLGIGAPVVVSAPATWPNDATIAGTLTIDAPLTLASGVALVVDQGVSSNAGLTVPAGSSLNIGSGQLVLAGGSTLDVDGVIGSVDGCVNNGAVITGTGQHPCGAPQLAKVWIGGDAFDPVGTQVPANWSPVGVPTSSVPVLIPVTGNDPVLPLTGGLSVASITIGDGAMLDMNGGTLTVAGDYDGGSLGAVNGLVVLSGPGAILQGRADALRIDANRTLSADLNVSTDVTLNNADLAIGGSTMVVTGDFTVTGGSAQLVMTNAADILAIDGNLLVDGGSSGNVLTNGVITLGGDFTANSTSSNASFIGQGGHTVILSGVGPQSVTLSAPGTALQRFANLTVSNTIDRVTFNSDFVVSGTFWATAGSIADATGRAMSVAGGFEDESSGIFLQDLIIYGNVASLTGGVTANVRVDSNWTIPTGVFVVAGNVTLNNADLSVGANTLAVTGDFTVTGGSAQLVMNSNGALDVNGDMLFNGGSSAGFLTDGVITLAGDLTVSSTSSNASFVGQGAHTFIFDGPGAQAVSFSSPGTTLQRFQDLTINNFGGTVTFNSDFVVSGTFTAFPGTIADATGRAMSVAVGFEDQSSGMFLGELIIFGNVTSSTGGVTANVRVDSNWTIPTGVFVVAGNVTLNNADLSVGANTLAVTGDFTVTGGSAQLVMNSNGALDVNGDMLFNGGSSAGFLTDGVITLAGDLTVSSTSSNASFVGQGAHTFIFDGPGAQAVSFSSPGTTLQRFQDLTINNFGGTVTFNSDFVVSGTFQAFGGTFTDATGRAMSVGGAFLDGSDGIFLQDLIIFGNLTSHSFGVDANVRIDANWTLSGDFLASGNVVLNNADLTVGGRTLTVFGGLTVTGGSAQLVMTAAAGVVAVDGNVLFNGGSVAGFMTLGTLRVAGDFTAQSTSSPSSFVSTGAHTVELNGSGAQQISFSTPGTTQQRFNDLTVLNGQAPITVSGLIPVMGTFSSVSGATMRRAPSTTSSLNVFGTLFVDVTTFDGLPLRLESTVPGPSQTMSDVTFVNMFAAEVQLFVSLPGGVNSPAVFGNMAFDGAVTITTGAHVQTERTPGGQFPLEPFVLDLGGATPVGTAATQLPGAGTQIIWP